MGRPKLTENAAYAEMVSRLQNRERILEAAKAECEIIMRRAERETEEELLAALWRGLQSGLSQYALGKATGKTRAEHQRALVERADRWGKANGDSRLLAPVDDGSTTIDGYKIDPIAAPGERTWVTAPSGERYTFERDGQGFIVWRTGDGAVMSADDQYAQLVYGVEEYAALNAD